MTTQEFKDNETMWTAIVASRDELRKQTPSLPLYKSGMRLFKSILRGISIEYGHSLPDSLIFAISTGLFITFQLNGVLLPPEVYFSAALVELIEEEDRVFQRVLLRS